MGALVATDIRNVHRDPMLRWLAVLPVAIALLLRYGLPLLTEELAIRLQFDLVPYNTLVVSSLVTLMPALVGMIAGFLLLDLRDDRTLTALRATPLGLRGFLFYRLTAPMLLSLPLTVVLVHMIGVVQIGFAETLLTAVAAAPVAPTYALFLATFANNKVQGFALLKAASVLGFPPILAWWVAEPWQWLVGIVPYYWAVKLFWVQASGGGGVAVYLVVGLGYQAFLVWLLLRRADRLMPD